MIYPSADRLEEKVESRYTLVVLAAKRAKQLREGAAKLIDTASTNPLTIALEEIAAGKVLYDVPSHDDIPTPATEEELAAMPELEAAEEEAAELTAEAAAPIDEAARVAELLRLPGEEAEAETAAEPEESLSPAELLAIEPEEEETEAAEVAEEAQIEQTEEE